MSSWCIAHRQRKHKLRCDGKEADNIGQTKEGLKRFDQGTAKPLLLNLSIARYGYTNSQQKSQLTKKDVTKTRMMTIGRRGTISPTGTMKSKPVA